MGLYVTDTWNVPSLLVATNNHILKLTPDAVGLRTYEVLLAVDGNVTALCVDIAAKTLYFATASPDGVRGLSVGSGNIFVVSLQNPATPYVSSLLRCVFFQSLLQQKCLAVY